MQAGSSFLRLAPGCLYARLGAGLSVEASRSLSLYLQRRVDGPKEWALRVSQRVDGGSRGSWRFQTAAVEVLSGSMGLHGLLTVLYELLFW